MVIGSIHLDNNGRKFGADGDLALVAGYLCLVKGLAFGGGELDVIPHPYHAQELGACYGLCHGSLDHEPGQLF